MRGLGVAVGAMRLRSWGLGQAIGCLGQVSISALSSSKDVPPMLSLQSPASVVRMPFRSVHSLGHSFPNARGCMPSSPLGQLLTALGSHGGQAPLLADPLANQLAVHVSAFGAPPSALSAGSMGAAGARHLTTTSSSNCRSSRSISGSSHSSSSSGRSAVPACVRAARGQRLRVAVAVSGGVDSAVAALLLVRAGHDVFGVFMRNWDPREEDVSAHEAVSPAAIKAMPPTGGHLRVGQGAVPTSAAALTRGQQTCVDAEARAAAAVCRALGIPFHEVDFVRQYWGQVFSDFIDTYRKGGTPNPDLACNRNIKFGELLTAAKRLGAEAIATGHYAQLLAEDGDISSSSSGGGGGSRQSTRVLLLQGIDPGKDQSYFLAAVPQEALLHCLFPIGHLLKSQVCNYAAEAGLAALMQGQRSSRGICFVGERRSFGAFMAQYVEPVPGQFVDVETRKALGPCDDILAFTPGQRARIPGSSKGAWYVAGKDMVSRLLILGQGHDHPALLARSVLLGEPNWLAGGAPPQLQSAEGGYATHGRQHAQAGAELDSCHAAVRGTLCRPQDEKAPCTGEDAGSPTAWVLLLQWERAMRCKAKVSYRQPYLALCWVVVGRWVRKASAMGSFVHTPVSTRAVEERSGRSCGEGSFGKPKVFEPSCLHMPRLDVSEAATAPIVPIVDNGSNGPRGCLCDQPSCPRLCSDISETAVVTCSQTLPPSHSCALGYAPSVDAQLPCKHPPAAPYSEQLVVVFDAPLRGLAPQQAVVLYELDRERGSSDIPGGTHRGPTRICEPYAPPGRSCSNKSTGWIEVGPGNSRERKGMDKGDVSGCAQDACQTAAKDGGSNCSGASVCLGSAVLVVPGRTVFEEQQHRAEDAKGPT